MIVELFENKMRAAVIVVLLLAAYCEARPSFHFDPQPTFGSGSTYIVGGQNATSKEFPWQLSQQLLSDGVWRHSCGASLLSANYALTAAHCMQGWPPGTVRVVAGVNEWNSADGAISIVASYKNHESYQKRIKIKLSDDIAILTLATPIYANGVTIQYAKLPENGDDLFVGGTGFISGWGKTAWDDDVSQFLLKARIDVIDTETCKQLLIGIGRLDYTQICVYDTIQQQGTVCSSDSGGPFNLDNGSGQAIVAGVTSWGYGCIPTYPAVYARTSAYLDWIKTNTP